MDEQLLTVLKWAGGNRTVDISRIDHIEEDMLLYFLDIHKLDNRFLDRVSREKPDWAGLPVIRQLKQRMQETHRKINDNIQFVDDLACSFDADRAPVVIKGFSNYMITGNPIFLRRSEDIDLMFPDSSYKERLHLLGLSTCKASAPHEEENYAGSGIEIDVHRYFPVSQQPEIKGDLFDGRSHQRVYIQQEKLAFQNQTKLTYEDLLPYAIKPPQHRFLIVKASLSVLIMCAHIHRNYLKFDSKYLAVGLGELSDIGDLTNSDEFDEAEFTGLAEKFQARDCLEFICCLYNELYGLVPDRLRQFANPQYRLIRRCGRLWGYFDTPDETIIPRDLYQNKILNQVTKLRGSFILPMTGAQANGLKLFSTDSRRNELTTPVIVDDLNRETVPLTLYAGFQMLKEHFQLVLQVENDSQVKELKFDIQFDRDVRQKFKLEGRQNIVDQSGDGIVHVAKDEGFLTIHVTFNKEQMIALNKKGLLFTNIYVKKMLEDRRFSSLSIPLVLVVQEMEHLLEQIIASKAV